MPSPRYTYEQFVTAWMGSNSLDEIAKKLEVSKWTVERTARILRKKGVKLPTLRANPIRDEPDIEGLNNLINNLTGEPGV